MGIVATAFARVPVVVAAAGGSPTLVGWVMGMCFSDVWGPRRYDERGHLIGLPGSYLDLARKGPSASTAPAAVETSSVEAFQVHARL